MMDFESSPRRIAPICTLANSTPSMIRTTARRPFPFSQTRRLVSFFAFVFAFGPYSAAAADGAAAGTVEGRVFNTANGEYVEKARITIEGTSLESFTDADGFYRLTNVPEGAAKLRAFFTGLSVHTSDVPVAPGQ